MMPARVIAIDWSGSREEAAQRRHIVAAEVWRGQVRLVTGLTRAAMIDWLTDVVQNEKKTVVGFDFSFSFPEDFFRTHNLKSVAALWQCVAEHGEEWLAACPPPFWGRPGKKRPVPFPGEELRQCEREISVGGIRPKSIYQIGGAGAAGTGSLRGMPWLTRLRAAGFSIFPFDVPAWPMAMEIYPRLLTGPVVKSSGPARSSFLDSEKFAALCGSLRIPPEVLEQGKNSEDAFDALVAALAMSRRRKEFAALEAARSPREMLEGQVWGEARD
jgi:hypothetical protein